MLCFTLYSRANSKYKPPPGGGGGLYLEERFNGGFFVLPFRGLIFGGAYTWRGLFSEFYGRSATKEKIHSGNTVMTETPGEMKGSQPITGSDSVYGADCPIGHLHDGASFYYYDPRLESFRVLLSCAI